jgi:hypothetical protein
MYRAQQKYLTILENSCEWNRWHGEFVLERPSSETQNISISGSWFRASAMTTMKCCHQFIVVKTFQLPWSAGL